MRNALFILIVLIVASCSNLPKIQPENPECRSVFRIRPMGNNWHDIRSIKDEGRVNTKMFPRWYDKGKAVLDGSNSIYFNPYSHSFISIAYRCFDVTYTHNHKKADKKSWEKYCIGEQASTIDIDGYEYKYSMPQDLVQEQNFETPLSFSAFEKIIAVPIGSNPAMDRIDHAANPRPDFYRLSIIGNHNHRKGFFLQLTLLTEGSVSAMNDFKSVAASVSFPRL